MRARILANLNWLVADKLLRAAGGLFIGIWIARYLGPEQFGALNYALAFVALFSVFARLGIDQIVVRELTRFPQREGEILGTVFTLKLAVSLVVLPLVILSAWASQGGDWPFTVLIGIVAVGMVFSVLDVYDFYYQAQVLSRYVVFARSTAFLFFSAVRVALILTEQPVVYFAATTTLEIALGGGILVWLYRHKQKPAPRWHFDYGIMVPLLRDGWPLILSSALIVIHTKIGQVMIGQMLSITDVGIYGAALRLSEAWLVVPSLLVQTLMPYFVKIREINPDLYRSRLIQLYSIMFWLSVSIGAMAVIFGEFFVILLFGEPYRDAFLPMAVIIWTGVFISQSLARSIWMIGENMQGYRLANNLIAVPINIGLNLLLIPEYGIVGASVAGLVSVALGAWVVPFIFVPMRESNRQMLLSINPKYLLSGTK
jgi:O-antigen/teichoic acid export membrane protein